MAAPPAKRPRSEGGELVAYPGEEGSLTHVAATRFFEDVPAAQLTGKRSFAGVFQAVEAGEASYGVIPIENSSSGTLHSVYDLLLRHDVAIGGELGVREVYCLCAKAGTKMSAVQRVLSHPNILEACSSFIEAKLPKGLDLVPMRSTTEATSSIASAEGDQPVSAAIATREAAVHHGLTVIAEDIGDDAFLETRYILIRRGAAADATKPCPFPATARDHTRKRSACFALPNEPGAAFKLLSCWALRHVDVLKLETRPLVSGRKAPAGLPQGIARLWDYLFYVDYAVPAGQSPEAGAKLWEALKEFSLWQRDFGTYPSLVTRAEKQPLWSEMVDLMAK